MDVKNAINIDWFEETKSRDVKYYIQKINSYFKDPGDVVQGWVISTAAPCLMNGSRTMKRLLEQVERERAGRIKEGYEPGGRYWEQIS